MRMIISGPTKPDKSAQRIIREALLRWDANNGVHELGTGCAWGVDTIAAREGLARLPDAEHHLFVPAAPSNVASILEDAEDVQTEFVQHLCQRGRTDADSYGIRNVTMCEWARNEGVLLAFPNNGREVVRSGTWWTVRIANRMLVPVIVQPLDGSKVVRMGGTSADYLQTTTPGDHHA